MPLPQIRDGQKLSLVLPADVVRRLKIEAMEEGTIPALIVLEALDNYWGGNSEASDPTVIAKDPKRRTSYARLLDYLDALVVLGKLKPIEIARAVGANDPDVLASWRITGYVPVRCVGAVTLLLRSKDLPISQKKD